MKYFAGPRRHGRANFIGGYSLSAPCCPKDSIQCSWPFKTTCCPLGTFCDTFGDVCCPTASTCSSVVRSAPTCADPSWVISNFSRGSNICCLPGWTAQKSSTSSTSDPYCSPGAGAPDACPPAPLPSSTKTTRTTTSTAESTSATRTTSTAAVAGGTAGTTITVEIVGGTRTALTATVTTSGTDKTTSAVGMTSGTQTTSTTALTNGTATDMGGLPSSERSGGFDLSLLPAIIIPGVLVVLVAICVTCCWRKRVARWVELCCGRRERGGKTGLRKGRVPWPRQENDNSPLGQEDRNNNDGPSEVGGPGSLRGSEFGGPRRLRGSEVGGPRSQRGSIMRSHRGGESVMEEYGAPPPYESVVHD